MSGDEAEFIVEAEVVFVNRFGWARAKIHNGPNEHPFPLDGDFVSIRPKYNVRTKDQIRCTVKRNRRRGNSEGWFAINVTCLSLCKWLPWQIGSDALSLKLPNTAPGSKHDGISFACWMCGRSKVESRHIYRIKNACIWTNTAEILHFQVDKKKDYNDIKKCFVQRVWCNFCNNNLGSYYKAPFHDCVEGHPFPCFKLTILWERKKWMGDVPASAMVLDGDERTTKNSIANLEASEEWEQEKYLKCGGRIDRDTYKLREKTKQEKQARLDAERSLEEAEKRTKEAEQRAKDAEQRAKEIKQEKERLEKDFAAKLSTENVLWECEIGGYWIPYPSEIRNMLEESWTRKEKAKFNLMNKEYEIDFSRSTLMQVNTKTKFQRKVHRREGNEVCSIPSEWIQYQSGENCVIVEVPRSSTEWKTIEKKMLDSMPSARLLDVHRIQNISLWEYFTFRKERMTKLSGGVEPNIVNVWHGTSETNPLKICKDVSDGFMMQYSRQGMWGRGIYFAKDAKYSHSYACKYSDGTKAMILAKLVSGEEVHLDPDDSLTFCPEKPGENMRYDTVTGTTKGCKVYIVYENGRAYPEYLVNYRFQ